MGASIAAAQPEASRRAAEQELRDFSYIVSHDLAATFRHVAEFTDLLMRDLGPAASEKQRLFTEHIRRETSTCQTMMEQLLVYSRIQQRELSLARHDMTHLFETAMIQLSAEARAAKAEMSVEALGEHVVDADLMVQAFKHALSNAIKFRRPETPLTVRARASGSDGCWGVDVIDNGVGVALNRQEKMFSMFYQDFPHGDYPGIGAGLAICRRILRRHGGDAVFVPAPVGACLRLQAPTRDFHTLQ